MVPSPGTHHTILWSEGPPDAPCSSSPKTTDAKIESSGAFVGFWLNNIAFYFIRIILDLMVVFKLVMNFCIVFTLVRGWMNDIYKLPSSLIFI